VIINVTGGPDLSLMEVNEASCVIQEAAHEDANIIFGAVEDPSLVGKVKITVIATGFDRRSAARALAAAEKNTPVDMTPYTLHLSRAEASTQSGPVATHEATITLDTTYEAPAHAGNGNGRASAFGPPNVSVSRRQPVEMSLPLAVNGGSVPMTGPADESPIDMSSPLDVPAFLRRQN
jgi:cell division protein FtsZ